MSTQPQSLPGDPPPIPAPPPFGAFADAPSSPGANRSLPPPPPPGVPLEQESWVVRFRWLIATLAVVGLGVGVLAYWAAQEVPYYSLAPGNLYPTSDLVLTDGSRVHDPEGEVLFTTVAVGPLTRFERWWLERDEDVDILPKEVVLGTRSRDENAALNQRLMDDSKQIAIIVALEHLGEDVDLRGTGAAITLVEPALPAAEVLEAGDTVLEVDGEPTTTADALVSEITERAPGDEIELLVEETDGDQRTESVALGAREDDPSLPMLGVVIETRDPDVTLPFEIDIDTGDVGGPSAGLAMTLAVLDVLTQGELTGGGIVAATGTMTLDGRVGLVGGVRQKTIAARNAGVELFLVPEGELAEARSHAGTMRVEGVATLEEALGVLRDFGGDPLPAVPVDETPAP